MRLDLRADGGAVAAGGCLREAGDEAEDAEAVYGVDVCVAVCVALGDAGGFGRYAADEAEDVQGVSRLDDVVTVDVTDGGLGFGGWFWRGSCGWCGGCFRIGCRGRSGSGCR